MPQFHNPYHFVPTDVEPPNRVPTSEIPTPKAGEPEPTRTAPHLTHDRFVPDTHSGSIECRITVETPLICANTQEERADWTKFLRPYILDREKDEPALPASGIRGMFSAIAETVSGSAMRVLKDRVMSYRRQVSEGLSAIGMIVEEKGALNIFPLAEPHYDRQDRQALPRGDDADYFSYIFPLARPKIYFGTSNSISTAQFLNTYLSNTSPLGGPFYAVHRDWFVDKVKYNRFWLGEELLLPNQRNPQGDVATWESLSEAQKASQDWIRGVLRVLGKHPERIQDLPTKRHEFFLRFNQQDEDDLRSGTATVFPIESETVTRFNELADERADAENAGKRGNEFIPFSPNGTSRGNLSETRPATSWQLKPGDIVFFRPSADGKLIVEVSLSSAWRGRVEEDSPKLSKAAPLHCFFGRDQLPLSSARDHLTVAEQLLGTVEIRDKKQEEALKEKPAFALASRLFFHNGTLASEPAGGAWQHQDELLTDDQRQTRVSLRLRDIPLKNLASPKLPSPSLYFKSKPGQGGQQRYVPKANLNPKSYAPQGRKFYLRRDEESYSAATDAFVHPGRLVDADDRRSIIKQHQSVERFVRPKTTFTLRIDFTNLSELELQLLVYCLRPSETFRHQLGHGKPLGLGQVKIDISALRLVDRQRRYATDSLLEDRWHEQSLSIDSTLEERLEPLTTAFRIWAEENRLGPVLKALELVGSPVSAVVPVHYPQTNQVALGNPDFESKHYAWFVQNDDTSNGRQPGQFLPSLINANGQVAESVPTMDRLQQDDPPPVVYRGPVVPIVAPAGQGAPRHHTPERRGGPAVAPGRPPGAARALTPERLGGKPAKARVESHEVTKKKGTTIRFRVSCEGCEFKGYLEIRNPNSDTRTYPEGDGVVHDFILLNPHKQDNEWHCQLKKPMQCP